MKIAIAIIAGAVAGSAGAWILLGILSPERAELSLLRQEVEELRGRSPGAGAAQAAPVGGEAEPAAGSAREGEGPGGDAEAGALSPEDLSAELEALSKEVALYRSAVGRSGELLAALTDPKIDRGERRLAFDRLMKQCDLPLHLDGIIDALRVETDPELRENMVARLTAAAVELRDPAIYEALLAEARGGTPLARERLSWMLANYHGADGLPEIRKLLADESEEVRLSAIGAIGRELPKSEAVLSSLREMLSSPDPKMRGVASLDLAYRDEPFVYEGVFDDWLAMALSMRAEEFGTVSVDSNTLFKRMGPAEMASIQRLTFDLGQYHSDENIRHFFREVARQLSERLATGPTPPGDGEGR